MIVYSVTVTVETDVHEEWLDYMRQEHIPDVMKTGCFSRYQLCKLITRHQEEGESYNIQYYCPDMKTLHAYQVQHAPALQEAHKARYGERALAFRTLLEVLED